MECLHGCRAANVQSLRSHRYGNPALQDLDGGCSHDVEIYHRGPDVLLYSSLFSQDVTLDTIPEVTCWIAWHI